MYLCVEDIVLPRSMYLYVEEIGFTSFYVFVCAGPIPSTHKYIERGKTDILNTQIHKMR
jgi:hypothetical protein